MRILVTGAAGQLGAAIARDYAGRATVVPMTRQALDIGDDSAVDALIARERPDAVINCAAYTDVDGAEDHAIDAIRVNSLAVGALARGAAGAGAVFVHYSTDFVFDGLADRPYTEDDEPAPQSVYASSKLLGEWYAADCPRYYVLRVESLFGGSGRRSSIDRIVDAIRKGEPARVFVDRTVTPSYTCDVADATWRLMHAGAPRGVYHCVNGGVTTWFELAKEIGRQLGVEPDLVPVKVADIQMKARRPQYAALSNARLARAGIQMPTWQDALQRYLAVHS
ncbi:MAG TPA: dTDP-4-dehydrorhamnose reductase [Vicinamibacterales bacterium]